MLREIVYVVCLETGHPLKRSYSPATGNQVVKCPPAAKCRKIHAQCKQRIRQLEKVCVPTLGRGTSARVALKWTIRAHYVERTHAHREKRGRARALSLSNWLGNPITLCACAIHFCRRAPTLVCVCLCVIVFAPRARPELTFPSEWKSKCVPLIERIDMELPGRNGKKANRKRERAFPVTALTDWLAAQRTESECVF